jgi:hypothetical protein
MLFRIAIVMQLRERKKGKQKGKSKILLPSFVSFARSSSKRIQKRVSPSKFQPMRMEFPHLHDPKKVCPRFPPPKQHRCCGMP